jgi:hypothetical protein
MVAIESNSTWLQDISLFRPGFIALQLDYRRKICPQSGVE